jgi:hypothetical protein
MARCGACNQEIGTTALGVYDPSYVHLTEDKRQREVCVQCHRAIGVWSQQESERTKCIMPGCMAIGNPRMRNPNCPHGILVSCQAHWQGTLSCMSRGHWDALMSGSTPDGTPKRLPPAPSVCGQVAITPSGVDQQQRANALADECQRLRDENTQLLAENARLRRGR